MRRKKRDRETNDILYCTALYIKEIEDSEVQFFLRLCYWRYIVTGSDIRGSVLFNGWDIRGSVLFKGRYFRSSVVGGWHGRESALFKVFDIRGSVLFVGWDTNCSVLLKV